MKSTASKTTTDSQNASKPFFSKGGEGLSAQREAVQEQPFFMKSAIQANLSVGAPDDPYEQEAEKVSRQVMSSYDQVAGIQRKLAPFGVQSMMIQPMSLGARISRRPLSVQTMCPECEQEQKLAQPKSMGIQFAGDGAMVPADIESKIQSRRGGGSAMDVQTRSAMETSFGADFSGVKVHTDSTAVQMSQQLNAHAFTVGNDIFFNQGRYQPQTKEGAGLLSHELTHTVQQGASVQNKRISKNSLLNSFAGHEAAHLSAMSGGVSALNKQEIAQLQELPEEEMTKMQQLQMLQMKGVDEVQKKDSSLTLRRCDGCNGKDTLYEEFKKKRANPPQGLLPAKPAIKDAAVMLGTNTVVMDSYHRFQLKEEAQGGLIWGFFFSKDNTLNGSTPKPQSFETWSDFNSFSKKQQSTLFQISRITGEVIHNKYSKTAKKLEDLKKAYTYWPSGYYAVHQSGSAEDTNTCNVFVGGSLQGAGYSGNNGGKLWSAAQIYAGANGNFVNIDKAFTEPGDIVAYGGHVGVVVTVDVENRKFVTREGYIENKGAEREREFDELLGRSHPELKVMRKK